MAADPATYLLGLGSNAFSSLINPPPKYQAPQYINPGQYQAPGVPNFYGQLPDYASVLQQAGNVYDPSSGQAYQSALGLLQNGRLPDDYRNAVLGQAQTEGQNAFNQASQQLNLQQDRSNRSLADQMNKMGLLSSGALGVSTGLNNEEYARQYGNLSGNLQNQMGQASLGLMNTELNQRSQAMQMLSGVDQQRASNSLQSRNALLSAFGQDRGLQAGLNTQQYGYQQQNAQNTYDYNAQNTQNQNSFNQSNAQGAYNSQKYGFDQNNSLINKAFQNLTGLYQGGQAGTRRRSMTKYVNS